MDCTAKRKLGIGALLLWTFGVTVLRTWRTPNDFAEAHWLLDYRFGFVKRGLVGQIVSSIAGWLSVPVTETLIAALAAGAFLAFSVAIAVLTTRLLRKSEWSNDAVLIALVFLSSPFVVMSAHLVGYYDNLVIVLGIASIALLIRGKPLLGGWICALSILVHENAILLVFPAFCLAWWRMRRDRPIGDYAALSTLPLMLPVVAFILVAVAHSALVAGGFQEKFTALLSQYDFIQRGRAHLLPLWISTSFGDYVAAQAPKILIRLASPPALVTLPTTLTILWYTCRTCGTRIRSTDGIALAVVVFAPQLMHLAAWDTSRIWTYSILSAFLALWVCAEHSPERKRPPVSWLPLFAVLGVNIVALTPLMDRESDHLSLALRLLLYSPAIVVALRMRSTIHRDRVPTHSAV